MSKKELGWTDIELVKLRAEALDKNHLKLATWGTKEELISVLRNKQIDRYNIENSVYE